MYLFLGHLKASFETFEKITDGGVIRDEISELEEERDSLLEKVDAQGVQRRLEVALSRISGRMLNHLKTLDVEDKYRKIGPRFDIQNLSISILSSSEHWHLLAQVGSASNWVSFHVALVCALQEFFIEQKNPCVPNFVIFDQPSQVYFPKLRKGETLDDDDKQPYEDEDVSAVKMIFNTIEGSVRATDGQWQAIVLDHADSSIYGDLSGVHEVAVWRNGEKLIPETWITSKS